MPDQADNLRHLIHSATPVPPASAPVPPMIVVTAGRRGLGVSTVATNLAAALADREQRVLLVDASAEHAMLADIVGRSGTAIQHTVSDVLDGQCSAASAISRGPGEAMLLASRRGAALNTSRPAQQRMLAELQTLHEDFDLVVVDIGSGLTPWTRRFWLRAQLVLLVTTTDNASVLNTYATVKRSVADKIGPDIRLVVNRCDDERTAAETHRRISGACQRFLERDLPASPPLPSYLAALGTPTSPRVWDDPNSPFGHANMWLARAVHDAIAMQSSAARSKHNVDSHGFAQLTSC